MEAFEVEYDGKKVSVVSPTKPSPMDLEVLADSIRGLADKECDACGGPLDVTDVEMVANGRPLRRGQRTVGMSVQWKCPTCGSLYLAVFPKDALEDDATDC